MKTSTETGEKNSTRSILVWSTPIILGHFLLVLWHLALLVRVQPETPRFLPPLLIVINLFPVAGLVVFAKGFHRLAGTMITIPLGVALVVGAYSHFFSPGSDNVLHMPPGALTLPFQITAFMLVFLEAFGCWCGMRMFTKPMPKRAANELSRI